MYVCIHVGVEKEHNYPVWNREKYSLNLEFVCLKAHKSSELQKMKRVSKNFLGR